jgi:hypothetical protein
MKVMFVLQMLNGISMRGSMPIFASRMSNMYGTAHRLVANTLRKC